MSLGALIPLHYKNDVNDYLKTRSLIKGMILFAAVQFLVAFCFLFLKTSLTGHVINISIAFYSLLSIYSIRFFKSLENYLNAILGGYYFFIFAFTFINTEYLSDAVYWLGILLVVNVLFTKKRHVIFWLAMILLFAVVLIVFNKFGMFFHVEDYDPVYRIMSLLTFFVPLTIIVLIHSKYCVQNLFYQSRAIRRLQRKNIQRNEMIDELSHDLKSPVNRISGLIQIMDRSNLTQDQLEVIDLIKNTNDTSNSVISSILGKNKSLFEVDEKYDLSDLVQGLIKTYAVLFEDKRIYLNLDLDKNCYVAIDKLKLIRILDNLISNAIKYSRIDGEINVSVKKSNESTKIRISDSGPGFAELDLKLLFQKRMKLTAKPTAEENSHGLGLNIVNKLSSEIGCHVKLKETSPKGSTFEVIIPDN